MIRQFKIHTSLDERDDEVLDVTNGKVRFYNPSNLGLTYTNSIIQNDGLGILGSSAQVLPELSFTLITTGNNQDENYRLLNEFINKIIAKPFVSLEYETETGKFYADLKLSDLTKSESKYSRGEFEETIKFNVITRWYSLEIMTLFTLENSPVVKSRSKIYSDVGYCYDNDGYTYYGESDIERFSRWSIDEGVFSFSATLFPFSGAVSGNNYGLSFLDENLNEYTAIVFKFNEKPEMIKLSTDVNNEYYYNFYRGNVLNSFGALDFQRFRTRLLQKGTMNLIGLSRIEMRVKKKAVFV